MAKTMVIIALGSNLGERADNLRRAVQALSAVVTIEAESQIYETAPMYVEDQPPFLNMAVCGVYDGEPQELLAILKDTERALGRQKTLPKGPRIIDLDIIFFGENMVYSDGDLTIPHPAMQERDFVLAPLMELCSEWVHPVLGKTVRQLYDSLASTAKLYEGDRP